MPRKKPENLRDMGMPPAGMPSAEMPPAPKPYRKEKGGSKIPKGKPKGKK